MNIYIFLLTILYIYAYHSFAYKFLDNSGWLLNGLQNIMLSIDIPILVVITNYLRYLVGLVNFLAFTISIILALVQIDKSKSRKFFLAGLSICGVYIIVNLLTRAIL